LPQITEPGQWALEICDKMKASEYLNPPGGKQIFNQSEFQKRGIQIKFIDTPELIYECFNLSYQSNLSILDVLMWNSISSIKTHLNAIKGSYT
jgi:hypothetical protein